MKSFGALLLFTVLAFVQCELNKEEIIELANACKTEVGASDEDVRAMFKHEPAATTEAKCMRSCLLEKTGIMNAEGKLVKETAMDMIKALAQGDEDKIAKSDEILDACVGIDVDEDHCEAAEQYVGCVIAEAKAKGFAWQESEQL